MRRIADYGHSSGCLRASPNRFAFFVLIFLLVPSLPAADQLPRCGLLIDPQLRQSPVAALFESAFAQDTGIIAVDRSSIDKVLVEQELQAMFRPDALASRSGFGKIVKAELLVMMRPGKLPSDKNVATPAAAGQPIELVVCETHRGLRVLAELLVAGADPQVGAGQVAAAFHRALARARLPITTIIAVPPFASVDLQHDYDYLQDVYPHLIQQTLAEQPGVLAVEFSEARVLSDELALAGGDRLERETPLYVTGKYWHDGVGPACRVSLEMKIGRAGAKIGSVALEKILPDEAPEKLRQSTLRLLNAAGSLPAAAPRVDVAAEARELADRSIAFARVGDWHEARTLAEASLLLEPANGKMHGMAYFALNAMAFEVGGGRLREANNKDFPRALEYFHQAVVHLEPYIVGTEFKAGEPADVLLSNDYWAFVRAEIQNRAFPPPQRWIDTDQEARDAVWRALHRKSSAKVDDAAAERFFMYLVPAPDPRLFYRKDAEPLVPDLFPAECEQFARPTRDIRLAVLKEFSYRHHATTLFRMLLSGCPVETSDPQWNSFLAEALKVPNPEIKQTWDALCRDIRRVDEQRSTQLGPAIHAPVASNDTDITAEKLRFIWTKQPDAPVTDRIIGCLPVADGVDLFWTTDAIFTMKKTGVLDNPIFVGDLSRRNSPQGRPVELLPRGACFDGQYAWFILAGRAGAHDRDATGDMLAVLDIAQGRTITVTKNHGLPPGARAITSLAKGNVCVGGALPGVGSEPGRVWCAAASVKPDLEAQPEVNILIQARDLPVSDGGISHTSSGIAGPIQDLQAVVPPTDRAAKSRGAVLPAVLVHGVSGPYFLLDPTTGKIETALAPVDAPDHAWVHGETINWIGRTRKLGANVMSRTVGPKFTADANPWKVPPTVEFFCDANRVAYLVDATTGDWLVSRDGTAPFRRLKGKILDTVAASSERIYASNHYGIIVMQQEPGVLQVNFPKPLPEGKSR